MPFEWSVAERVRIQRRLGAAEPGICRRRLDRRGRHAWGPVRNCPIPDSGEVWGPHQVPERA